MRMWAYFDHQAARDEMQAIVDDLAPWGGGPVAQMVTPRPKMG
jgi:hypothetical protein